MNYQIPEQFKQNQNLFYQENAIQKWIKNMKGDRNSIHDMDTDSSSFVYLEERTQFLTLTITIRVFVDSGMSSVFQRFIRIPGSDQKFQPVRISTLLWNI